MSQGSINARTSGHIINVMSSDCEKLIYLWTLLAFVVVGPLVLMIVAWFSYKEMGYSALMGLGIVLLMFPFQCKEGYSRQNNRLLILTFALAVLTIYLFSKFRLETARKQDKRIGLMNEIISCMKLIKMYCWESEFAKKISKAREEEIKVVRSSKPASIFVLVINKFSLEKWLCSEHSC